MVFKESKVIMIPYFNIQIKKFIPLYIIVLLFYGIYVISNYGINIFSLINDLKLKIFFAQIIILFGIFLRFLRWRIYINALKLKSPLKIDFLIWMSSFAFLLTPGKAGEIIRSFFLKEKLNHSVAKTIPCILMERLSDGVSVLLIISFNIYSLKKLDINFFIPISLSFIFLFILVLLKKLKFIRSYILSFLSNLLPKKFSESSYESLASFDNLIEIKVFTLSSFLGICSWILESLSFWILLKGLNLNNISFEYATIAHLGAGLAGVFTFLPGGLGATEIGTTAILTLQNIPIKEAMTATILIRLMTFWFATLMGILALVIYNLKKISDH